MSENELPTVCQGFRKLLYYRRTCYVYTKQRRFAGGQKMYCKCRLIADRRHHYKPFF